MFLLDHQKNIFIWLFLFHIWISHSAIRSSIFGSNYSSFTSIMLIPSHLYKDDEEAIVADDLYKFYCDDELIPL